MALIILGKSGSQSEDIGDIPVFIPYLKKLLTALLSHATVQILN
jgi:hypothetical protein